MHKGLYLLLIPPLIYVIVFHYLPMVRIFRQWRNVPGVSGLHMAKEVKGPNGIILRGLNGERLLPDVQFWYRGKFHVWEVVNTNHDPLKKLKYELLLQHNGFSPSTLRYH